MLYNLIYYLGETLTIIVLLFLVAIIILIWTISTSNRFKFLLVKVNEADSGIDVALNKRYDTLIKLMNVVKAYAKHESETFSNIVKIRSGMGLIEKVQAEVRMHEISDHINIIAESYPELRSSENFKQLQDAIVESENHLQAARRVYNASVSAFNQSIVHFPRSIIAKIYNYTAIDFFDISDEKRSDVTIDLK